MKDFELDLIQAGADDATRGGDGVISVYSEIEWESLAKRSDFAYTLINRLDNADKRLYKVRPVDRG